MNEKMIANKISGLSSKEVEERLKMVKIIKWSTKMQQQQALSFAKIFSPTSI